jgi:HPt (histidine-containing phosphotransfer) domain-containing protein
MLRRIRRFVTLPADVTVFERRYLERNNRIALSVLAAHLPVLTIVALWNGTRPAAVAAAALLVLLVPFGAALARVEPRRLSIVCGVAAVLLAGLLVHAGQGPMQTEMHFQFFVVIATFAVYGNPQVVLAAAATIALVHVGAWALHPASLFSSDARGSVVATHVLFIGLESMAACFISRIFFDNVIRLEKKVGDRTVELSRRQRDVRLLLDSAAEGFMTIDATGTIAPERSAVIDDWLGPVGPDASWFAVLAGVSSPDLAARSEVAWQAVLDDFLPIQLTLAQMPSRIVARGRQLDVAYRLVSEPGAPLCALVILRDVTADVARQAATAEREEDLQLLSALLDDAAWTRGFLSEATRLADDAGAEGAVAARALHTLKGNARVAGFTRLAELCHDLEDRLAADRRAATAADLAIIRGCVRRLASRADALIGAAPPASGESEPVRAALERAREHARRAARAAGREVEVIVDDGGVQIDAGRWAPIWTNLVHAVQNAVDHGIEPADERVALGKPERGCLLLRARDLGDHVVVEREDDGRGPAWASIAARARALGVQAETDDDLSRAPFADGLSTKGGATATSGRGVGLASLRAAALAAGGDVRLEGSAGIGATLRIEIPRTQTGAPRRERAQAPRSCTSPARPAI